MGEVCQVGFQAPLVVSWRVEGTVYAALLLLLLLLCSLHLRRVAYWVGRSREICTPIPRLSTDGLIIFWLCGSSQLSKASVAEVKVLFSSPHADPPQLVNAECTCAGALPMHHAIFIGVAIQNCPLQ